MTNTVFNQKNVDYTKEPMFLGEGLNSQRFDKFKYAKFDQINEQMLGFFWRPQEVSLQKDRNDYKKLNDHEKFIFTENLKYQTLLDSVQGRSPVMTFLPICSLPELESAILTWDFYEGSIHSKSYSYIMQNVFPDPSVVFNDLIEQDSILKRATSVTEHYDNLYTLVIDYLKDKNSVNMYEIKKALYLAMVNVNILEGLRFYNSFACTFAFGENKMMEGSAKIVSLIARDENLHFALTTNIINYWKTHENDKDFLKIIDETYDEVVDMYLRVIDEEHAWAKHLFNGGSMIGLNETLLNEYINHMAVKRAKNLGYELNIDVPKSNPLPWTNHWLNTQNVQVAPQETEITSYVSGGIDQDIGGDSLGDLNDFEL